MKRVRIEEFFRDYDKLRKGKVTIPQFKSVLSLLNFSLTEEEMDSLSERYRTTDPEGTVNYFAFCHNINLAFTRKGIDKHPTVKVKPVTSDDTLLARRKYLDTGLSPDDQIIADIIQQYRVAILNKRLNLKPMFQDFDITKNSHCSKAQFLRVLTQLGIMAPDQHVMNLLLKRYLDMGNLDEVNYVDFCNDIDSPEDIFGVGRDYNMSTEYFPRNQARATGSDILRLKPEDIEDCLARIRKQCKEQRIRVGEFLGTSTNCAVDLSRMLSSGSV